MDQIRKAVAGFVFAAGTALGTAALEGGIDTAEWWGILAAGAVTGAAVFYVPNAPESQ